jgi:hypothetical protein
VKLFIVFGLVFTAAFQAKAVESVSFQNTLYALTCSKTDGTCQITKPADSQLANVALDEGANGNLIGRFSHEMQAKSFVIGADVMVVHSTAGYYLLFITSWIQDAAKTAPRLENHVSVTVNSLAELNRVNLPSPDLDGDADYGHSQFMIWSQ